MHGGVIRLPRLVELMSVNPARILKVPGGSLTEGAVADITILAPDLPVTIDRAALVSRSTNTPYHGWTFRGGVAATIVGGRVVYANAASKVAGGSDRARRRRAMMDARRDDIRARAVQDLRRFEVVMEGHFDYGNGYHGRLYLNPHQLFRYPVDDLARGAGSHRRPARAAWPSR